MNLEFKRFLKVVRRLNRDAGGPRRAIRFPGLMTAAHQLGVHRNHLYQVLAGKRVSHSLTRKFNDWKRTHQSEAL